MVEDRIAALEARAATLEARVRELEHARPAPPPRPPARPAAPPRPRRDLEELLGGRVLAWVGGVAVLAGLAFLLTIAISRGWIGEGARTALAGGLSVALLATGIVLRGRVEAALAAAAVGIAGCFGTLVVAGNVYDLVPVAAALAGASATGALATALAIRWRARAIGWLGLLGALLAPAALGALDGAGIVFLATAFAASVAVLAWQDWSGLAWAAFAAATLQWLWWLAAEDPSAGATVLALATFGLLTAALAFGLDARRARLHPTAAALVPLNAAILAAAGAASLDSRTWLAALAAAHVIAGAAATRTSRALALIAVGSGVALADLALPAYASGVPLALTWAASALVFAALFGARRHPSRHAVVARACDIVLGRPAGADRIFAAVGLVAQLTLAAGHLLVVDAPPVALGGPAAPASALVAAAGLGVVALACARLAGAVALDWLALAALAYLTGLTLEGLPLTLALAAEAVVLTRLMRPGAIAFAALALMHAVIVLAPPAALIDGLEHSLAAGAALAAAALAVALATRRARPTALTILYAASVEVVTLGGPHHTGQTLLSVLWAVAGVAALVHGLRRDNAATRRAALALIALTASKVFLYDLASLDSLYRVGSFIGFGLLLLAGAFAYQRMRPQDLQLER